MKKTLIALMALAGVAAAAETTITAQFTDIPAWKANFYSDDIQFVFTLDSSYTLEGSGSVLAAYWGQSLINESPHVGANAFTLSEGTNGTYTLTLGRGQVFNYTGETWENATISKDTTFTFSSSKNGSTESKVEFTNAIKTGVTYTLSITGADHKMTPTLSWVDEDGVKQELTAGYYTGNMAGNPPEGKNIVYSINSGVLIPEPATATLSLLALAGLCARRRRA